MSKLKLWQQHDSWEDAEAVWEAGAKEAAQKQPLKSLKVLPSMPGVTPETAKNLRWKSFKWMVTQDHDRGVLRGFLRHPFRYGWTYLKSLFKKNSYSQQGDFFLYGVESLEEFQHLLTQKNTFFVLGFSYCHKPFECPSGRFTDQCIHDPEHPVCRQCFIGKAVNALSEQDALPLFIPTVHYIGTKIFELIEKHPDKKLIFLITACEMTLKMFGDWGNMVGIQGIGVRLDGRICNTMEAFALSERGVKPGLTVVLDGTQRKMLELIRSRAGVRRY